MKQKGKIVMVSGGSRGLGAGMVEHLLQSEGNTVITFSRKKNSFIRKMEKKYKRRFFYREVDQKDLTLLKSFVEEAGRQYKRIDVLINNAGIAREGVLAIFQDSEISSLIQMNLESTIQLTRLITRIMIPRQQGSIINISSIIGFQGFSGLSVYAATKAGLIGFTKSLARELGKRQIRVNVIAPGYLETDMSSSLTQEQKGQIMRRTPLGRLGQVQDVLPVVDLLMSDQASFITGQTFVVDGGASC